MHTAICDHNGYNAAEAEWLVESCLLKSKSRGLLPEYIDVQATARAMARSILHWTNGQRAEALMWRSTFPLPKVAEVTPEPVRALINGAIARGIMHAE